MAERVAPILEKSIEQQLLVLKKENIGASNICFENKQSPTLKQNTTHLKGQHLSQI